VSLKAAKGKPEDFFAQKKLPPKRSPVILFRTKFNAIDNLFISKRTI
jgi:hypothetical protein